MKLHKSGLQPSVPFTARVVLMDGAGTLNPPTRTKEIYPDRKVSECVGSSTVATGISGLGGMTADGEHLVSMS